MILIVGATGVLGGKITQRLLAEKKGVRILIPGTIPRRKDWQSKGWQPLPRRSSRRVQNLFTGISKIEPHLKKPVKGSIRSSPRRF